MSSLERIRDLLPEPAKDVRLNLQAVLQPGTLSPAQRWGVAVASAAASRNASLFEAVVEAARGEVEPAVVEDAIAAASLMAMNNVYYRGKPGYSTKPARLRMNRLVNPATNKLDFELFSLAVSAINACETCIQAHENVVREGGLGEDQVHDAVRIAATIASAAVALETRDAVAASSPLRAAQN
jgi:lipoyl-dependent peroxiredoxin subunit D